MIDGLSISLLVAAASIGVVHTLLGPDHYVPFIALARAEAWTRRRTLVTVGLCGTGHVLGSVLLGSVGIALGAAIGRIEALESGRADWAAWCTVLFGGAYALWGLRRALRSSTGLTPHRHGARFHLHTHGDRAHRHREEEGAEGGAARSASFWVLLFVFVLGPCEPLLPLFVLPAARGRWDLALATVVVYGLTTIATMLATTLVGVAGSRVVRVGPLERWMAPMAGGAVAASGLSVLVLGL